MTKEKKSNFKKCITPNICFGNDLSFFSTPQIEQEINCSCKFNMFKDEDNEFNRKIRKQQAEIDHINLNFF